MIWEDDPQDRAPMTEAIDTIEALRAELAECKQEIIDRHNAEENLKQSWIDLDDETKALRARVAELEAKLAAAPMLLEAAKFSKVMIDHFIHKETGQDGLIEAYDNLKKAIAAAEGR